MLNRQRGQAIVYMMMTALIIIVMGLFILNAGILTSEKMQLQNAADATAFSVSTIEARDLNFTAYTNRAMVSNEVAIGQLVGLMSWAVHFSTVGPFMNFYFNPILTSIEAGTLGIATFFTVPMRVLIQALTSIGQGVKAFIRGLSQAVSPAISAINKAYSIAQRSFHMISFVFSITTLDEMIRQNAPGAGLSGFGLIALLGHFTTYYSDLPPFNNSFVTSYRQDNTAILPPSIGGPSPTSAEQKAGMERLASIINATRDPFSENRFDPVSPFSNAPDGGWKFPIFPPYPLPPIDFTAALDLDPFGNCPRSPLCIFSLSIFFQIAMDRNGGTDLRYVSRSNKQLYNWSAVDTTAMNANVSINLWLFGAEIFDIGFSSGPPLAIGAAQAGRATGTNRAVMGNAAPGPPSDVKMMPHWMSGQVEGHAYGGSPDISTAAWSWPTSPVPGMNPSQAAFTNNIFRKYPGLPRYNDTKAGPDPIDPVAGTFGFEAPYLIIGLVKDEDRVAQSTARGRFQLTNDTAQDYVASMAKSEVYFSRPNSLSYFRRGDGNIEYGSGFNPYWQARLVDTTYLDRVTALAIQQQRLWLPNLSLGPIIDDITNILSLLP